MNPAATAMSRAGEAAAIAISLIEQGDPDALSSALSLTFGEVIDALVAAAPTELVDQRGCVQRPCPAVLQAVGVAARGMQEVTGRLSVELLTGLVLAVRRLAEVEGRAPAEVVATLVAAVQEV